MQSGSRHLLGRWLLAAVVAGLLQACGSSSPSSTSSSGGHVSAPGSAELPGRGKPRVVLGTKNFPEAVILGQLYTQALRARGFSVSLKANLGSSEVMAGKLTAGVIDGYPEYTGTILSVLAHDARQPPNARVAYLRAAAFARRHGQALLDMASATDTDVVIAKPQYAAAHKLRSLADLAALPPGVTIAAAPEFRTRYNGLVGLRAVYGAARLRLRPVAIGSQYEALADGRAQLAAVFTTDGQLTEGGYALLADPQNIFGFQNVTFDVRRDVLDREGPAFARTLNAVSAKLSTQALRVMNAAVVLDQQDPATVARQFLAADGLA
jgi:osmoprotectant transport system substrate-binding protein